MIAAANVTHQKHGPDRIIGFSPIPAMSMISYAAGSRYLSLIRRRVHEVLRLVLRPCRRPARRCGASRPTCPRAPTGTTLNFIIAWGSNVPQTRARRPLLHRGALQGRQVVPSRPTTPRWPSWPTCGCTPNRAPMPPWPWPWACDPEGVLTSTRGSAYFDDLRAATTDLPLLVVLEQRRCPRRARTVVWCRAATCAPATSPAARPVTTDMNYRRHHQYADATALYFHKAAGLAHYVGCGGWCPQTGWTALALRWTGFAHPGQMNSIDFHAHTDQWRCEKLGMVATRCWPTPDAYHLKTTTCAPSAWAGCLPAPLLPRPTHGGGQGRCGGHGRQDYVVKSSGRQRPLTMSRGPRPPRTTAAQHVRVCPTSQAARARARVPQAPAGHHARRSTGCATKPSPKQCRHATRLKASWTCWSAA